jgi:hypothetical protein
MSKGSRIAGAAIVLVGAILLLASLLTPWYTEQVSVSGATENQNAYTGLPDSNGTIQYSCSNLPTGVSCPSQSSYTQDRLNNTGLIAETGYFLIIGGIILGLVGAIIGLTSGNNPRRAGPARTLAVVSLILAIVAVAAFAVALPMALSNDIKGHSGDGPWSSFFGSGNSSSYGIPGGTLTWGPGFGWYFAIVAFVLLLVGAVLLARGRKDAVAVPTPAPATSGTAGAPPTNAPPSP